MASSDSTIPPHTHGAVSMEVPLKTSAPPPDYTTRGGAGGSKKHAVLDVFFRVVLFGTALAGVIVMVTSKQTKLIPVAPGLAIYRDAKFNHSPSNTYLVAALSVACLYSIITGFISVLGLVKPGGSSEKMKFHFVILDSLLLGIVAAATGAAGGVAYVGLKGNSHSRWNKICETYDSYCIHVGTSIVLCLISSIALLLLVWVNVYALSKKIARR